LRSKLPKLMPDSKQLLLLRHVFFVLRQLFCRNFTTAETTAETHGGCILSLAIVVSFARIPPKSWPRHSLKASLHVSVSLQEPHAKQVQELLASQEAVAKERTRLEAVQDELKARRAEVAAQVE
jgi:hypothetical protein